jgi:hypothetical protein
VGWNFCIAMESDRQQARLLNSVESSEEEHELFYQRTIGLSRHFSYALFNDDGELRRWLTKKESNVIFANSMDDPDSWEPSDPQQLRKIFCKIKKRLKQESEKMPVDHFLWYIDETGERWNGSTQITLPFGGITLELPQDPIVKLDGSHNDPDHRWELRQYEVRIDPDLLAQYKYHTAHEVEKYFAENSAELLNSDFDSVDNITSIAFIGTTSPIDPLVKVPIEWIPVEPVPEVLGHRVEVESIDALSLFQADLDTAIECCEEAIRLDSPFYWLIV